MTRTTRQLGLALLIAMGFVFVEVGCSGEIGDGGEEEHSAPASEPTYSHGNGTDGSEGRSLYFYYGPMKQMLGESVLYSVAAITGHEFGAWDYTCPDPGTNSFANVGNGDGTFYRHCRLLGGCMEHRIPLPRTSFVGSAYVLEIEKAIALACSDREAFGMFPGRQAPVAATQVIEVINHQYMSAFSSEPSTEDLELSITYFDGHLQDPEFDDVTPLESAGRGHCRAILGTNRFLFY